MSTSEFPHACPKILQACTATAPIRGITGRPFLRGLVAGISTGVGLGISYVHADERYLAAQAAQVEGLPANKR